MLTAIEGPYIFRLRASRDGFVCSVMGNQSMRMRTTGEAPVGVGRVLAYACAIGLMIASGCAHAAPSPQAQKPGPDCATDAPPYRDFDFLIGDWEFFTLDGQKIGKQTYSKREQGCLILEDWSTIFGDTGTGMNFVDPATGLWRQVWMSPLNHLDYSGGLNENGDFVLEGRIYPNDGSPDAAVRGVYSRRDDGSVEKAFWRRDDASGEWARFFVGIARRPAPL
jgi:hypothetical protein